MNLNAVIIISQRKKVVKMLDYICKHCGEPILPKESIYRVEGGYVHVGCMEDYVEDMWYELNLENKMQLLDIDTGTETLCNIISSTKADYDYEGRY